ncbi:TcpQ domain-containing protein [Plesiomonas shigelloides subsp. oncorhynchi]|nr:TcpQ domain-containing protein [Plesiomonas shigelloides]
MTVPVAPAISVTSTPTVTKPIVKPLPIWIASPTFTLQENMTAWANKEGWVVVWNTQVDYPIQVEFRIQDTFLNLVKKLSNCIKKLTSHFMQKRSQLSD